MGVLRDFRRAVDALERIASGLNGAVRSMQENAPSLERLQTLERDRTLWEADVEALLMKAQGKLQAAANAEARTRTMKKAYEEIDPFDAEGEEVAPPVSTSHVEGVQEAQVQHVPVGLAPGSKAYAQRAKFI